MFLLVYLCFCSANVWIIRLTVSILFCLFRAIQLVVHHSLSYSGCILFCYEVILDRDLCFIGVMLRFLISKFSLVSFVWELSDIRMAFGILL